MFGWKGDSLQRALKARCSGDKCSELLTQSAEDSMKCTVPQTMKENVDGCKLGSGDAKNDHAYVDELQGYPSFQAMWSSLTNERFSL